MGSANLVDPGRIKVRMGAYGTAQSTALVETVLFSRVQDYRRQLSARMIPLDPADIRRKIATSEYHVSRKLDGEFTVLLYNHGEAVSVNSGGTVRIGLPWIEEAAKRLDEAGLLEAMLVGELHIERDDGMRARIHDVISAVRTPGSQDDLDRAHFAVFDLMSVNGERWTQPLRETRARIEELVGGGERIAPVEGQWVQDARGIEELYKTWVNGEECEGIVVRGDRGGLYKIKPQHTLDVVVVGFSEGQGDREGMLHDLLVGVLREDGSTHLLTRVGGGFTDEQRRDFLLQLKELVVESDYAAVNTAHVAYQMVRPSWVIEITGLSILAKTTRGGPINRMVLDWDAPADTYRVIRRLPLASVISPRFVRRREDKQAHPDDASIRQIADVVEVPLSDQEAGGLRPQSSTILRREVYTKELKGALMVRKLVMWKTNKESEEEFPGYVVHYTDYSPNRKTPLNRDIRVSSSREQIDDLWDELLDKAVKGGWVRHAGSGGGGVASESEGKTKTDGAAKKPAAKPKAKSKTKSGEKPSATSDSKPKPPTKRKPKAPKADG